MTEPMAEELIARHPMAAALKAFRGMPACDTKAVAGAILKLSALMSEIPAVARVIINPLLVDENGLGGALCVGLALRARVLA